MTLAQPAPTGVEPIGPGGLLSGLTKSVLETALQAVLSEIGPVQIEEPRDRDGSFHPPPSPPGGECSAAVHSQVADASGD